ncbi:hypothetical protein ABZ920_29095 [Streptomyces sp. NPDC046831]|uniref:hypothetical protein n=1 Tax=Streptomyces sp. NPDC046831 TaxID=3154805 RepID=UPI0033D3611E
MRTWSESPFTSREDLSSVPQGTLIARDNGESRLVYEIEGSPGWLAKLYKRPADPRRASDLQRLVYLPTGMSQADQDLVDRCLAWPTTRIYDGADLVGVVMAKAPEEFFAPLKALSGWKDPAPLPLDWLMKPADKCAQVGLRPPDPETRLRAVEELLSVGALFARHDIVYADWSYRNALWNQHTGAVFVIDMDSCGIGSRDWVESPGWADPLFPDRTRRPTVASDHYKLAVMALRCLTAERQDPLDALSVLEAETGSVPLTRLLRRTLTAKRPQDRPDCRELLAAVQRIRGTGATAAPDAPADPSATRPRSSAGTGAGTGTGTGNVTTWIRVGPSAGAGAGTASAGTSTAGAGTRTAGVGRQKRGTQNSATASNVTGRVNLRDRSATRTPAASAPATPPPPTPPTSPGPPASRGTGGTTSTGAEAPAAAPTAPVPDPFHTGDPRSTPTPPTTTSPRTTTGRNNTRTNGRRPQPTRPRGTLRAAMPAALLWALIIAICCAAWFFWAGPGA